jgi:Glycosyl hydrolases family 32 N-terminal domain
MGRHAQGLCDRSDMVHWRHMPTALSPSLNGCSSGSAVIRDGVPTILYTRVVSTLPQNAILRDGTQNFYESQSIAISHDPDLRSWSLKNTAPRDDFEQRPAVCAIPAEDAFEVCSQAGLNSNLRSPRLLLDTGAVFWKRQLRSLIVCLPGCNMASNHPGELLDWIAFPSRSRTSVVA